MRRVLDSNTRVNGVIDYGVGSEFLQQRDGTVADARTSPDINGFDIRKKPQQFAKICVVDGCAS